MNTVLSPDTGVYFAQLGALAREAGSLRGAGIVLGTALATIDVNALYDENMRKKGAAFAEGRRFAYTTPNAAAGECSMAFGLTGPNLAVSRGLDAHAPAQATAVVLALIALSNAWLTWRLRRGSAGVGRSRQARHVRRCRASRAATWRARGAR